MRRTVLTLLAALALVAAGPAGPGQATHPVRSDGTEDDRPHGQRVVLRNAAGADVGYADLGFTGKRMHVRVRITGATPGFHGFHVHSVGQCDGTTTPPFTSAGGHWNPDAAAHGAHDGDMPPLYADANGVIAADFATDAFTLDQVLDADGAALVVHAGPDNLGNVPARYSVTEADGTTGTGPDPTTRATGDAGARFACGVVARDSYQTVGLPLSRSRTARAVLRTTAGAYAGVVRFAPAGTDRVHVSVDAAGLAPGFHGFHVHSVGQCDPTTATPFSSAGPHLGGGGADHGRHAGDMPPLFAATDGRARAEFDTDAFTLAEVLDADGGALVVHAAPDNLANIPTRYSYTNPDGTTGTGPDATTRATGDSGARVLCGVVVVPPPPAVITLAVDFPVITAGNTPQLVSTVTDAAGAPAPDVLVTFHRTEYGQPAGTDFDGGWTDESGRIAIRVQPFTQTSYVARAGELSSAPRLVAVHARVIVTSPAAGASVGSPTTFTGRLLPEYAGQPVGLATYVGSGTARRWLYLAQARTGPDGTFTLTRALPRGTAPYVVYTSARNGTRRGSSSLTLTVR